MKSIQAGISVLCVLLLLAPMASAQQGQVVQKPYSGGFSSFTAPYQAPQIAPIDLANSNRLEQLLRAGNIYLSLQDAIALALENNLDIAYQRYQRPLASAQVLRVEAGGLLRGIPTTVQNATTNALSLLSGGFNTGGGGGSSNGGGGGSAVSSGATAGGTIITATGSTVPNLDPLMYFVGQAGHRTQPQTNTFVTGTTSQITTSKGFNWGIQKGFLTGTTVSLGWNDTNVSSNLPYTRNDYNPFTSANVGFQLTQHLLQGWGLAANTRYIRVAKNNIKYSDLVFKQQVMQTVAAIIGGYWDLVSAIENVKVQDQALQLSQKLYEDNKKQVEIGTLAPIEITKAEAEVASNQQKLVNAQTSVLQQEVALKNALSRTGIASPTVAEAHIIPTDRIQVPAQEPVIPVQDLVAKAFENRPDLVQTRINIQNAKISLAGTKSELLPSLDLIASLQNNALVGQVNGVNPPPSLIIPGQTNAPPTGNPFFIGGFGSALGQIFRRNFPDYSIGFQLIIPLRNRAAQADMIIDQVNIRQAELAEQRQVNGIRVDVRNALIGLQQASAAYKAAVKARELAEQTLDAEQKRYALGASTIFYVIQYQRDLAQARSNEVAAESQYAKAKNTLDLVTGQTLEANNISIDEAWAGKVARQPNPVIPNGQR